MQYWHVCGQAGTLFLSEANFWPTKLGRTCIFYANLKPMSADEMYQDFENTEHGKFWSGGRALPSEHSISCLIFRDTLENPIRLY